MSQRRERVYHTEAVVLRRSDLGEADRLLTLYTPAKGKLRAIAKGVRRPTSRKAGHLELFAHSMLLIARGKTLDIVTQADTLHPFRALREDLERITYAHYVVELLDRFSSEGQDNSPLFRLLVDTLERLDNADDLLLPVRFYELRLLALEGYQPQLFHCLGCGAEIRQEANYFDPERGGVLCPQCGGAAAGQPRMGRTVQAIPVNSLKVLRFLQTHDYQSGSRLRLKPQTHRDTEALMVHYITYILERNLKSVEFIRRLRREG